MADPIDPVVPMKVAADHKGCVYDTFRKQWRAYVRNGFPPPLSMTAPYFWRLSSLRAWQERAEEAVRVALLRPAPEAVAAANQNARPDRTSPPGGRDLDRERNAVFAFMQGGGHHRAGA